MRLVIQEAVLNFILSEFVIHYVVRYEDAKMCEGCVSRIHLALSRSADLNDAHQIVRVSCLSPSR